MNRYCALFSAWIVAQLPGAAGSRSAPVDLDDLLALHNPVAVFAGMFRRVLLTTPEMMAHLQRD